ncbi:hypothetical protein HDU67_009157 [Dinochytrium kinnereticum]|nr:hypothetical protein HDU67_009157 [Dinochytrium kinnereticum]
MCAICSLLGKPRAPLHVTMMFYKMARSQLHTVFESAPDVDTANLLKLDEVLSEWERGESTPDSEMTRKKVVFLLRICVTTDLCV